MCSMQVGAVKHRCLASPPGSWRVQEGPGGLQEPFPPVLVPIISAWRICLYRLRYVFYFPTVEARRIRVLMVFQRGKYTETNTKRAAIAVFGPPPGSRLPFYKTHFKSWFQHMTTGNKHCQQNATVKHMVWRVDMHRKLCYHYLLHTCFFIEHAIKLISPQHV